MNLLRILVVDDNPADIRLLTEYLCAEPVNDFEVVAVQTLQAALERMGTEQFAAVLLDLNLPDSRGLAGLEKINAIQPRLPVIVLTGLDDAELSVRALSKHAQDYIVKGSITSDVLIRSIRYAIERNKAREVALQQETELNKRADEILRANAALRESQRAALNLMEDAVAARKLAEEAHARAAWLARFPQENPAPVLRVSGDGRVLYANPVAAGAAAWTCESGKALAPPLFALVERAMAQRAPIEQDVELAGRTYSVAVALFPQEGYVNLYGRDITEHKRAEAAIARAKQEWERTFDSVPDLITVLDKDHHIVRVNRAAAERLGKTPAQCIGLVCYETVHGCKKPIEGCPHVLTLTDGQEHDAEVREERTEADFLVSTSPLHGDDGQVVGVVHVARDITERKRREEQLHKLNRALTALGHSGHALIRATNETDFLKSACEVIVQDCGYAMVWIGFAEEDEDKSIRPAAFAGFEEGYLDTLKLTWADTERGRGPTGTAIRTGQVCRCLNMLTDPKFSPWRTEALKRGYASSIALPLLAGGKAFGALTIYARDPVGFVEKEVNLLEDLAADFAQGITSLRAHEAAKRAEQAVRESEERYRSLFNTMTEGFARHEIICDDKGKPCDYRFLDINPAFERLTGLKRDEVVGKTVREIMPGIEPIWIERYGRVALTGVPDHFEQDSRNFGRHYEATAYRNAPGCFAVIFTDVTELRAMRQREQEDAVRLAWGQSAVDTINAMREGVVLLEMDGTITSINPAVEQLTGFSGGQVVGRTLKSLLPSVLQGADLKQALDGLLAMSRGKTSSLPPLLLRRRDGKTFHVLPSVSLMEAPEGGRRVAVLTLKDVTDLHEASQRLEESEKKYRELVENANSIIMRLTPDHDVTFFNEYAQKFFGYEAGEILGKNVVGTIVPARDSEGRDLREMVRTITESPELHAINENENTCKDGRRVWVHWANRAIRDNNGKLVEILCVGTDITRRREMEDEARRYQQRLRELAERLAANEEEDRWRISRYIHDTIIQNLSLSNIRLGAMEKPLTEARLNHEADKLRQVRALLDQASDECRMVMSDLTPALLYELGLIPALNDLAERLQTKHGALMIVEDDGREKPMSHPLRGLLFESVRELIMNALKYAGPCEIRVALNRHEEKLTISVKDNGKGFDPSADAWRGHQGGFGLFSIRQRLEGLGGQLDIESAPGKGTTATIRVPVY